MLGIEPCKIGVGPWRVTMGEMLEMYRGKCELDPVNAFVRGFGKDSAKPGQKPAKPQPKKFTYPINKNSIEMLKVFCK